MWQSSWSLYGNVQLNKAQLHSWKNTSLCRVRLSWGGERQRTFAVHGLELLGNPARCHIEPEETRTIYFEEFGIMFNAYTYCCRPAQSVCLLAGSCVRAVEIWRKAPARPRSDIAVTCLMSPPWWSHRFSKLFKIDGSGRVWNQNSSSCAFLHTMEDTVFNCLFQEIS